MFSNLPTHLPSLLLHLPPVNVIHHQTMSYTYLLTPQQIPIRILLKPTALLLKCSPKGLLSQRENWQDMIILYWKRLPINISLTLRNEASACQMLGN